MNDDPWLRIRDVFEGLRRWRMPVWEDTGHEVVRGTIGMGKSHWVLHEILQSFERNCPCTYIDPKGDTYKPATVLGSRQKTIALLLLDTGIRGTERCTHELSNGYMDEEYIKVHGKGNKQRVVQFGTTTKNALLKYIHTFRPEPANESVEELILTPQRFPLSYKALAESIKRLVRRANLPRLHLQSTLLASRSAELECRERQGGDPF